ncbi:TonB-dependent receptor [Thiomicrorhabdus immobilis]|uniref:TonB-dependent receptor n=1 Tax=Thiomicrorhabdus immobilis TaxID=2791037 RepID=A0ABM7MEF2_9GAMM|nr:TonB-dependent receptor [Thiomicrorhabdus immobilis]BCN93780.1 TonB-dependent receptor [Thiomicrorhabdus immobilis]
MNIKLKPITLAISTLLLSTPIMAEELAPIIVNADLRQSTEQDLPASVDVKTQADLQDQGATHFDDVLLKTPNVNYSGQSSRARHIQIRGIGERDEYTGAPNSSVGFAIDDIDFSGIGMVGNLFDVKQVEVLRGPQNTRYGQSAIGGLINIQTNDSTAEEEGMAELTIGQDNLKEFGIVTSGPINTKENAPQYRLSIFKHGSDGFRTNETLDRTDTNGRDELTLRGKMRFFPDSDTTVDVSVIHADLNNGYDAWSADNTFTTLSNDPGKDTQLSNAASLKVNWKGNANYVLESKTSLANSDMKYGYDYDWGPTTAWGANYENQKERKTYSQELRWLSTPKSRLFNNTDWLVGLYASHLDETNHENDAGWLSSSDYTINKFAGFGQLDIHTNNKTTITASLRAERNDSTYKDDYNRFDPDEMLWGASLSYSYKYNDKHAAYAGITRGYKTGGFNSDLAGTANESFDSETLYNYEIGLKSNYKEYGLKTSTTFFYMDRHNPQFDGYTAPAVTGIDPWLFYTENFDSAQNYGLEGSFNWASNKHWNLYGSVGLIQTNVEGNPASNYYVIVDREQAHAPNYQMNLGTKYSGSNGFYAQADITAVDKFYFDNVHNFESKAYVVANARIGYETPDYEVYLWSKNLTDERYATRGFYFDLDGSGDRGFIRLGDPRQLGVTARVYF